MKTSSIVITCGIGIAVVAGGFYWQARQQKMYALEHKMALAELEFSLCKEQAVLEHQNRWNNACINSLNSCIEYVQSNMPGEPSDAVAKKCMDIIDLADVESRKPEQVLTCKLRAADYPTSPEVKLDAEKARCQGVFDQQRQGIGPITTSSGANAAVFTEDELKNLPRQYRKAIEKRGFKLNFKES